MSSRSPSTPPYGNLRRSILCPKPMIAAAVTPISPMRDFTR